MARLLQGDVGSGKTIVALLTALLAAGARLPVRAHGPDDDPRRAARRDGLPAPRRLERHARAPDGPGHRAAERPHFSRRWRKGEIGVVVGTHALLEKPVAFRRLGLVVVDEQHRFGVAQRATLPGARRRDGEHPHVLVLSATPIPRSLALTLHGDLDVSTLDEKPPGRTPVVTRVATEEGREDGLPGARERARRRRAGRTWSYPSSTSRNRSTARAVASGRTKSAAAASGPAGRGGAREDAGRGAREGVMASVRGGRPRRPRRDDGRRGRHRRPGGLVPRRRERRAVRARTAPPAAREDRQGREGLDLRAPLRSRGLGRGALASRGPRRDRGRVRRRRGRPEEAGARGRPSARGRAASRSSGAADPLADRELLARAREEARRLAEEGALEPFEETLLLRRSRP